MKYAKPEVAVSGLALVAIESSAKEDQTPLDGQSPNPFTTPSAYQADE